MRVAMVYRAAFGSNWADAAETVADVVRIRTVRELDHPGLPDFPSLAPVDEGTRSYLLRAPRHLPRRLLGAIADVPAARHYLRALRYLEQRHGPFDILHAHFYPQARTFPWVAPRLGAPYVVTEHSSALTRQSPERIVSRRGIRIAKRVYREAAAVIPVSNSLRDAIVALDMDAKLHVIPNPVDTTLFKPAPTAPLVDELRLISVARLARVKGLHVLLDALRTLAAEDGRIRLTIVGDGPLEAELREHAAQAGLHQVVSFRGHLGPPDIAELLRRSHIFVLPSFTENLSIAIIEALCTGLPVVATAVGGNPELVTPTVGELVPPNDADAFGAAVRRAIERLPQHDGRACAAVARARYSWESVGRQLGRVYEEALSNRAERAS